ncbi:hypothetical protein BGW41_002102 [Actinomortierella wolfii]|nr:hypothetical protein BGW41_002102 [Actinomortierella wolfii]
MARQRSRAAPVQQKRSASTMPVRQAPPPAAPAPAPAHHAPAAAPQHSMTAPPAQPVPSQGPGLFAQMASTAAGVAVGSAVGHTIGAGITSMFSGSSSEAPAAAAPAPQAAAPAYQPMAYQPAQVGTTAASCEADSKAFMKCLEANNGDMNVCQFYYEQLRACQNMASQY